MNVKLNQTSVGILIPIFNILVTPQFVQAGLPTQNDSPVAHRQSHPTPSRQKKNAVDGKVSDLSSVANEATVVAKKIGVQAILNNSAAEHRAAATAYRTSAILHDQVEGKLRSKHGAMSAADRKAAKDHETMAADLEATGDAATESEE